MNQAVTKQETQVPAMGLEKLNEKMDVVLNAASEAKTVADELKVVAQEAKQCAENAKAMGNGAEEIKNAADFVTRSNNDDGIVYALEKLIPRLLDKPY